MAALAGMARMAGAGFRVWCRIRRIGRLCGMAGMTGMANRKGLVPLSPQDTVLFIDTPAD